MAGAPGRGVVVLDAWLLVDVVDPVDVVLVLVCVDACEALFLRDGVDFSVVLVPDEERVEELAVFELGALPLACVPVTASELLLLLLPPEPEPPPTTPPPRTVCSPDPGPA